MIQFEARQFRSNRHRVVHQGSCQQLAVLAIDDALPHRLPNALGNAAVNLALDKHWIELPPAVINCHEACNLGLSGILVNLNHADMRAEWEDTCIGFPENRCLQPRLDTWG